MSQTQSPKASSTVQKDGASRYLEALAHAEQLLEAQPAEDDKSVWRRWARELIDYEVKTLTPREKRAPRLVKYSDGAGERFLAVMKAIEVTDTRLKNGDGGPSSSGESEPEESTPRRSKRQLMEAIAPAVQEVEAEMRRRSNDSPKILATALNLTDAQRTINYEVPCARCARAGIACAGKEGRACFTCRAHRQGCELSSRALRERARTDGSDKEGEEQGSVSTAVGTRSGRSKGKEKQDVEKDEKKKKNVESESTVEARGSRPRRAATLVSNWRAGSPKTIAQLRARSPDSILRKRRATDADLSVTSSGPPGPSPLKKVKASTRREDGHPSSVERDVDQEEVRDALLVCEAAFRQLRKALRL